MEKYKKLLDSEIPEDVAMGICFLHKSRKLVDYMPAKENVKVKCKVDFGIQFNTHSIWYRWGAATRLDVTRRSDPFLTDETDLVFDFRT